MHTESELFDLLQRELKNSGISLWRIENTAGSGIPDVVISCAGITGWIELKTLTLQKQKIVSLKNLELSNLQITFLCQHFDSFIYISFDGYKPILIPFLQLKDYCEQITQSETKALHFSKMVDFVIESTKVQEGFTDYKEYLRTMIKSWMEK